MNRSNKENNFYWYKKVPNNWIKTKVKYLFKEVQEVVGKDWDKFDLLTLGKEGVKLRNLEDGGKFPESFHNYKIVNPSQLIFCLFDVDETPRTIGIAYDKGIITSAYDIFDVRKDNDPMYWMYFFQMIDDQKGLKPFYTGLRKVVRKDTFNSINIFKPPYNEQKEISSKINNIDRGFNLLITNLKKKNQLLMEKRRSQIYDCITKGINKEVKLKNTKIRWINKIPVNWEYCKLAQIIEDTYGGIWGDVSSSDDEGTGVIRSTEIDVDGNWKSNNPINIILDQELIPKYKLIEGDILITKSSGSPKHIGKSAIVTKEIEKKNYCYSNFLLRIRFKKFILPELYHLILNSYLVREQFKYHTTSSTGLGNLNIKIIKSIKIPLIPTDEQKKIYEYLNKKVTLIDKLINDYNQKINITHQYLKIIKYNLLTGQNENTKSN